jgi:hypothetical protein
LQVSPIQIGTLNLRDFEIPESIRFGGRHRVIVHSLTGGRRTIERLGPDDSEIQFKGIFSGLDAENRARSLNDLRLSGDAVWLTWQSFRRQVIIKSFIADYHNPRWIPYRVSCLVVDQERNAASLVSIVMALLSSDLRNALSAAADPSIDLTNLQGALSRPNVLIASSDDQARAIGVVASTINAVNSVIDQQSTIFATSIRTSEAPSTRPQLFASRVGSAGSLAAAVNVRSYVGRIGVNLGTAG